MNEHGFAWMLLAIILFLVGLPVAEELHVVDTTIVRASLYTCLLVIGVWSLRGAGKMFAVGMAFAAVGILLNFIHIANDGGTLFAWSFASLLGFLVTAIWHTLKIISRADESNIDRLIGAVCLYLLLGLAWAIVYSLFHWVEPESFAGLPEDASIQFDSAFVFFSFVTMTALGYGDIVPLTPTLRTFAYLQAIVGQFYLAIMVASLVSAYIASAREKNR